MRSRKEFPVKIIQKKIFKEKASSTLVDGSLNTGKIKESRAWLIGSTMSPSWMKRKRTIQFKKATPTKAKQQKLLREIIIISHTNNLYKKIGRKVSFPMMELVIFSIGSTIQRAPVRIPMTERQVETMGSQVKSISTPKSFFQVCLSVPTRKHYLCYF
jgi:hypothetical protein